jgi:hypothetical protein
MKMPGNGTRRGKPEVIAMTGAYEFICKENSTDHLCASLNALGGWKWGVGDSYWYGDYVRCVPFEGVRIRIVDFPTSVEGGYKYDADVRLGPNCTTPMQVIDEAFRKVLAALGARDVKEIDPFD